MAKDKNAARDTIPKLEDVLKEKEESLNDDSFIEYAPDWLEKEDPAQQELIKNFLPLEVLGVVGGQPRAMKSLMLREIAVACATETPAFGIPELMPCGKFKVLICAQEDKRREERIRIKALLIGRGIRKWPDTLALAIHKQISLDDPNWIERLKRAIIKHGFQLVIIDPARRFSKKADKGPSEVSEVTNAIRDQIIVVTHCTILIAHHFTKDPVSGQDARTRTQKISGGDWFAAAEVPIILQKMAGTSKTFVIPSDYKYSEDPAPFTFEFKCTKNDEGNIQTIQLVGKLERQADVDHIELESKIKEYLSHSPNRSGSDIAQGIHKSKSDVLDRLKRMFDAGILDSAKGKRNAVLWFHRCTDTTTSEMEAQE